METKVCWSQFGMRIFWWLLLLQQEESKGLSSSIGLTLSVWFHPPPRDDDGKEIFTVFAVYGPGSGFLCGTCSRTPARFKSIVCTTRFWTGSLPPLGFELEVSMQCYELLLKGSSSWHLRVEEKHTWENRGWFWTMEPKNLTAERKKVIYVCCAPGGRGSAP